MMILVQALESHTAAKEVRYHLLKLVFHFQKCEIIYDI